MYSTQSREIFTLLIDLNRLEGEAQYRKIHADYISIAPHHTSFDSASTKVQVGGVQINLKHSKK